MPIIDIYRAGYEKGYQEAIAGERRFPRWELLLRAPSSLLPGVDTDTYVKGYQDGYTLGLTKGHWQSSDAPARKRESSNSGAVIISIIAKLLRGLR